MEKRVFVLLICAIVVNIHSADAHKKKNHTRHPVEEEYDALFSSIQQKVQFPAPGSPGSDSDDSEDDDDFGGDRSFKIVSKVSGTLVPAVCQKDGDCGDGLVCSKLLEKCVLDQPHNATCGNDLDCESPSKIPAICNAGTCRLCGADICSTTAECCAGQICDNYNGLLTRNRCRQGNADSGSVSASAEEAKAVLQPTKNKAAPKLVVHSGGSSLGKSSSKSALPPSTKLRSHAQSGEDSGDDLLSAARPSTDSDSDETSNLPHTGLPPTKRPIASGRVKVPPTKPLLVAGPSKSRLGGAPIPYAGLPQIVPTPPRRNPPVTDATIEPPQSAEGNAIDADSPPASEQPAGPKSKTLQTTTSAAEDSGSDDSNDQSSLAASSSTARSAAAPQRPVLVKRPASVKSVLSPAAAELDNDSQQTATNSTILVDTDASEATDSAVTEGSADSDDTNVAPAAVTSVSRSNQVSQDIPRPDVQQPQVKGGRKPNAVISSGSANSDDANNQATGLKSDVRKQAGRQQKPASQVAIPNAENDNVDEGVDASSNISESNQEGGVQPVDGNDVALGGQNQVEDHSDGGNGGWHRQTASASGRNVQIGPGSGSGTSAGKGKSSGSPNVDMSAPVRARFDAMKNKYGANLPLPPNPNEELQLNLYQAQKFGVPPKVLLAVKNGLERSQKVKADDSAASQSDNNDQAPRGPPSIRHSL